MYSWKYAHTHTWAYWLSSGFVWTLKTCWMILYSHSRFCTTGTATLLVTQPNKCDTIVFMGLYPHYKRKHSIKCKSLIYHIIPHTKAFEIPVIKHSTYETMKWKTARNFHRVWQYMYTHRRMNLQSITQFGWSKIHFDKIHINRYGKISDTRKERRWQLTVHQYHLRIFFKF